MFYRRLSRAFAVAMCLAAAVGVPAAAQAQNLGDEPNLTEEQKKDFLLHARIIKGKPIGKGITQPWRLTLSDGTLTHDAAFQSIDISGNIVQLADPRTEINFRDSYHFNIAAWELAKLLGLDEMVPVTVERSWGGNLGSLSWWVPRWKTEFDRKKEKLEPPDAEAWNKQMYKVRVFDELIYDTDPSLGNVLITTDWKIWRINFTRAFGEFHDVQNPEDSVQCDRQLLEKLRKLDYDEVLEKTKPHLTEGEVKAVMARRDKIVAYFEKLIAQKGEGAVLY